MKTVETSQSLKPGGHYSQAIEHNGLIYVSGQLPQNPNSEEKIIGSIEEQTKQTLTNLEAILKAANSNINHILKMTVYISDMSLWGKVNEVYAQFFGNHKPARAIVPTRELHFGYQIEIDAIATVIKD